MSEQQAEVERKYDVPADARLPDLSACNGLTELGPAVELDQTATYHDTADLRLLAGKVTLRRRVGGVDDGWHLKLPGADPDERLEVRLPPGDEDGTCPPELLDRVRVLVRDSEVVPVLVLRTGRRVHRLVDSSGAAAAEVCDDHVEARLPGDLDGSQTWREWEVELVDGDLDALDAVEALLQPAGARRATVGSKAARVLAHRLPPDGWRSRQQLPAEPTAGDVLVAYLAEHLAKLQAQDILLRSGEQEGVHQVRVAARRMRSALATYASILEPGSARQLREELRWLGLTLSDARDAQVLRTRLDAQVAAQPAELVLGPVTTRIDDELRQRFRDGRSHADEALSSTRYFRLLDSLEGLVAAPPLVGDGHRPAHKVVHRLLRHDLRRVLERHRRTERSSDVAAAELALHEVRKAAKRLRYAGESAQPVLGKPARKLARRAEAIQELLGEHQDTVVARATLRQIAVHAHLAGENGFTFGRLHALQEARAAELRAAYPALIRRLRSKRLTRALGRRRRHRG